MVVLITGIVYDSAGATVEVKTDTLRPPGEISGQVNTYSEDNGGVLCYIPGTSYLSMTDESGFFVLSNIPQGRYKITYRKEGLKTVSDTGIEVRSGERTRLGIKDMEADPSYPPPAPVGLYVIYDTLSGCVILRWNRVVVSDLAGYVVYRNDSASATPIQISKRLVTDTFYIDTVFSDLMDRRDLIFTYRVKSQDKEANLSSIYSKPFTISTPSPTKVRTFFLWHYLNTIGDSASIGDSVVIIVEYQNATRKNMRVSWYFNRRDSLVRVINDTSFFGRDTIKCVWLVSSRPKIYVSVVDEGNSTWWDSTEINIVQDVPGADAGEDTVVSINSLVLFSGRATQRFGSIVMYKWDYDGDGTYDDSSSSSGDGRYVYRYEGVYNARFYVRDDDGNEATDEREVRVVGKLIAPVVSSIRSDTTVSINDTVDFYGVATDEDGSIVEYGWDFNGDGVYEYIGSEIRMKYVYTTAGTYRSVLRVTDDDGNSSKGT